mgnify:CR=1 FL=1
MNKQISGKALAQKVRAYTNGDNPDFDLKNVFDIFQIQIEPALNQGFENITQNRFGFVIEVPASHITNDIFNKPEHRLNLAQMLGELLYKVIDTSSPEHTIPTFRNQTHKFDAQDFTVELLMPKTLIQKYIKESHMSFDDLAYKFQVLPRDLQKQMFRLEVSALSQMHKEQNLVH